MSMELNSEKHITVWRENATAVQHHYEQEGRRFPKGFTYLIESSRSPTSEYNILKTRFHLEQQTHLTFSQS